MIETGGYQSIDGRLYMDVGNTRIKAAVYTNDDWQIVFSEHSQNHQSVEKFCESLPPVITEICIASVSGQISELNLPLPPDKKIKTVTVSAIDTRYLNYQTASTLGIDRFLACLGACHLGRDSVVVVDAGTACTIDFMDLNHVFHGGYITPGLAIREKGLREFAPSLPEVTREIPDIWPGRSTRESIQWGITGGFVNEIRSAIQNYRRQFGNLQVWVTGGDAAIIDKYLPVPCRKNAYLVFEGMRIFPSVEA